ncbi:D-beta-hydroxybutyrate dehydrogenase, mitochondrial-like [Coccinella septempunctata]|uniref:D-beta-hydroxybutyrate dehydrogenase, mitochondrial-like n=1 Tax=Coccinella septempunctata TaxID=41139 RepID=UPI001D089E16|nr:D-beta-hydroxybutyrate dehydrogenase, mitochondrial-like [Coccinella septempunctata]
MDEQTAFVLALQILALFSIAGALLLYLICKIQKTESVTLENIPGASKPILVTCADNAIGLQISIHLANRGFRVFSGLKEGAGTGSSEDSVAARVIRSWQKNRESQNGLVRGSIVALPLDVNREDLIQEAADIIRAHLQAGEDGLWAVINTTGLIYRGRLDQQDISHWEAMFKTNLVGVLRTSRAFQGLPRNTSGRIVTIGREECSDGGFVSYAATRYAVLGATDALRKELAPTGIKVISLEPKGFHTEDLYVIPKPRKNSEQTEISVDINGCLEYYPKALPSYSLQILDVCLTTRNPKPS